MCLNAVIWFIRLHSDVLRCLRFSGSHYWFFFFLELRRYICHKSHWRVRQQRAHRIIINFIVMVLQARVMFYGGNGKIDFLFIIGRHQSDKNIINLTFSAVGEERAFIDWICDSSKIINNGRKWIKIWLYWLAKNLNCKFSLIRRLDE